MTGRGAGLCAGYDVPGYANSGYGRGFGRGMGGGRGRRNQYYATGLTGWQRGGGRQMSQPMPSELQELAMLREETTQLRAALAKIEQRVQNLQPKDK